MDTRSRLALALILLGSTGCYRTVMIPGGGSEMNRAPSPVAITATPEMAAAGFGDSERERITAVQPIVHAAAKRHGIDAELINGVIWVESRFVTNAKSPAGAKGLMQLMPATAAYLAEELGVARPRSNDPEFNIEAGSYYLRRLIDRFEGDETLAIAAYNAGPGNVKSWQAEGKDLPDYSQNYVVKVLTARARFTMHTPDAATQAPAVAAATNTNAAISAEVREAEPVIRSATLRVEGPLVPEPPNVEETVFAPAPDLDHAVEPAPVAVIPDVDAKPEPAVDASLPAPPPSGDVGVGVLPDLLGG